MENIKLKIKSFLNGYYYPLLIFASSLIAHTFSCEPFGIAVIGITVGAGFILCDDLKFFITPLIVFIFMFSEKSVASGVFYKTPYIIAIVIFAIYLVALLIIHFIIHKDHVNIKSILKSRLFVGFAALFVAFLFNGFFNFNDYIFGNFRFALIMIVSFGLIFFIFYTNLDCSKDIKNYLFYVLYLVSILLTLQLFLSFTGQIKFVDGEIVKESIKVGWGMWNNIGGMLSFLLPVHFYFASTSKRFNYLFFASGLISYLAIVLTLSRSSLLVSSCMIAICILISCFKGCNKKTNRIITAVIIVVGIIGIIFLWDKIANILGDYLARGLDDNGRFDIYKHGFKNFTSNPIFGGGFYSAYELEHTFIPFLPFRYHNTIVQMLATCGIVGLLAYILHRYQTIKLFWQKRSLYSVFAGLCIGSMLLCSMLDNHFFNIYPAFIYSIILVVIEKGEKDYIKK